MRKTSVLKDVHIPNNEVGHKPHEVTPFDLRLVTKKIRIKFSTYKISTQIKRYTPK